MRVETRHSKLDRCQFNPHRYRRWALESNLKGHFVCSTVTHDSSNCFQFIILWSLNKTIVWLRSCWHSSTFSLQTPLLSQQKHWNDNHELSSSVFMYMFQVNSKGFRRTLTVILVYLLLNLNGFSKLILWF